MQRTPVEQIRAVLANLAMAEMASRKTATRNFGTDGLQAVRAEGKADAFQEAIQLIKTECANLLKED